MTLIDGDKIVTAHLYDNEHEEFTEKKMSIIDYVNAYTDEGITTANNLLDNIKSDLWMEGINMTDEYQGVWVRYRDIERIIDKYKIEREV